MRLLPIKIAVWLVASCGKNSFNERTERDFVVAEPEPQIAEPQVSVAEADVIAEYFNPSYQVIVASGPTEDVTEVLLPGDPDPYDFLFVLDNSLSMLGIRDRLRVGFEQLAAADFPEKSRVAIISTMVKQGDVLHPAIKEYPGVLDEPGFLSPVNAAQIEKYTQNPLVPAEYSINYPLAGCSQGWFHPLDKHPLLGHSCFSAHTQLAGGDIGCEPGLAAIRQYITKNAVNFQANGNVHIIIVSDTHHPGCPNNGNVDRMPFFNDFAAETYDTIKAHLQQNAPQGIANLMIHALAPFAPSECPNGESWFSAHNLLESYFQVTNGKTFNVCGPDINFLDLLTNLFNVDGKFGEIELTTTQPSNKIKDIFVNEEDWRDNFIIINENTIRVSNLRLRMPHTIRVKYN